MTKSFFFIVTGLIFSVLATFHFLRLMFEWEIMIGSWVVPGWISGIIVLFGIFMVYWAIALGRGPEDTDLEIEE